jgi:hypothetical protein
VVNYQLSPSGGVTRLDDGAAIPEDPNNRDWIAYQEWLADGNTPDPAPAVDPRPAQYAQKIQAGLAIASAGTPALNGTYAIDADAVALIGGTFAGIVGGKGLPGNEASFKYRDIAGAAHDFTEDSFADFAQAVRDYRYALALAAAMETPVWPDPSATIP